MNENSRLIQNTAILYTRLIFVSVIGLLTSRYILDALGVSDFGLYNVVGGIVTLMSFLNIVMISTTYRFIAFELATPGEDNVIKVFNISRLIHIFLAFFVLILAFTFGIYYIKNFLNIEVGKLNDALFVFTFSVFGIFFSIITIPFQGLMVAKEKFNITAIVEILRALLGFLIVFFLINYSGSKLRLYSVLIALVNIIPSIIYYLYCKKYYSELIKWKLQKEKEKYKEMIKFSGWIMLGAGASVGETQGTALIINSFFGTILNSSFGIASQVNSFVKMFSQSLGQAVVPQITKSYSTGNNDRVEELVIYTSKYSFFMMLLPVIPLLLETDYILQLWLNIVPVYTNVFVKIMLVNALISAISAGMPAVVHASGKLKYFQIILSSIMLIGLPIAYFVYTLKAPPYSILLIYSGTSILMFVVFCILLKIIINFNIKAFLSKAFLKMIIVVLFLIPLFLIRDFFEFGISRFIILSIVSVLWTLIIVYIFGLEKFEKTIIINFFLKLKNKIS